MQRTASPRGSRTVGKAKPAAVIETLADLTPDPRNARRHNPRNVGMLEKALGEVGAARSIVIDERGVVPAGNATIEAAARAGIEKVQVVDADGETIIAVRRTGLTAKQKTRLALYDNRTAELADWDADVIADLLATERAMLDGLFADDELTELLDDLGEPETTDAEPQMDRAAELNKKWQVKPGDLWRVGEHRLLCGDSTKREDVERVMGGKRAKLAPVDPPYNVGFDYDGKTVDDKKTEQKYEEFSRAWFAECQRVSDKQIVTAGGNNLPLWLRWFDSYHVATWIKRNTQTHGRVSQFWAWEPIIFFGEKWGKKRHLDIFDFAAQFSTAKETANHPCPKPWKLGQDLIENYSEKENIIYEPFAGSGTTLVASENLQRKCFGIEISPNYCAVILERMQTAFPALLIERIT